ncbi:MAG: ABC transporter permease, partial [Solobacterium sp.]|nr:ABC transporter permease [Solobacterium sp.]
TSALAGHPVLGLFLALIAGAAAGSVTAFLQTRMGVPSILAGIVTNTGLYTINLMVMGWSSNASLLKQATVYIMFKDLGIGGSWSQLILSGAITLVCMLGVRWFLTTRLGLSIRATGDNREMVSASSINPRFTILIGLMIANSFTALSGALIGQMQKSADINSGTGIVVIGLACLIIGETVMNGRKSLTRNIAACLIGNIIYRFIYALILQTRILPIECLKLMTAVIVALAIAAPTMKDNAALMVRIRKEKGESC